jgi:hypothetical protein
MISDSKRSLLLVGSLLCALILSVQGDVSPVVSATRHHLGAPVVNKALNVRGGARPFKKKAAAVKKAPVVQAQAPAQAHHAEELMSAPTAVTNVLADLCPHGMLPIGKTPRV